MERVIMDRIAFEPDAEALKARLLIEPGSEDEVAFDPMLAEARRIARPKLMYRQCDVEHEGPGLVKVEGVDFESRVLAANLEGRHRAVAYAITCGTELEAWAEGYAADPFQGYWTEAIREAYLFAANEVFCGILKKGLGIEEFSMMNPGSLPDWPISAQIPLFALLGDTRADIGLELTESLLMLPRKSVSGIAFPVEERFESCQLCTRASCPNRRLPYDAALAKERLGA